MRAFFLSSVPYNRGMKRLTLLVALTVSATVAASGTIYKVVLEDGTVLFTDKPVKNGQPLDIQSTASNTMPALASPSPSSTPSPQSEKRYHIAISSPSDEATIRNNTGDVTIASASSTDGNFIYELWLDGKPVDTNTTGVFKLSDVLRGAHQYFVQLKDNKGKTLASSEQRTLYMHRASVLINQN